MLITDEFIQLYYTYVSKVTLRIWGLRLYRSILTEIAQNCSEPIFMLLGWMSYLM